MIVLCKHAVDAKIRIHHSEYYSGVGEKQSVGVGARI